MEKNLKKTGIRDLKTWKKSFFYVLLIFFIPMALSADTQIFGRNVSFRGSGGFYVEDYYRDTEDSLRPPGTVRLYLMPTLSISGISVNLNLNLFVSSEQTYLSQDLNTVGISPSWSWGGLSLGDFYPKFSPLTMNYLKVRGAGFRMNPGLFRFAVAVGYTQRASTDQGSEAFERMVYAIRVGIGRDDQKFLDLNILKFEDNAESIDPGDNYYVTPKENLVASLRGQYKFWKNRLRFSSEIAVSAFSRDIRSETEDVDAIPEVFFNLFQPRHSSYVDYASFFEGQLTMKKYSVTAGVKYLGPGYESLGLNSYYSDRQMLYGKGRIKLLQNKLVLRTGLSTSQNNLIENRSQTTERNKVSLNATYMPIKQLNLSSNLLYTTMTNFATRDSLMVDFNSLSFNGSINLFLRKNIYVRSVSLTGTYIESQNNNPVYASQGITNYMGTGSVQSAAWYHFTVSPFLSISRTQTGTTGWQWITSIGASLRSYQIKKWMINASLRLNMIEDNESIRGHISVAYKVFTKGTITLKAQATDYTSQVPGIPSYFERMLSLRYHHIF